MFIATINVPGYLPDGDQPPAVFNAAAEAWAYLAEERELALNLADMVLAEVDLAPAPGDAPDLALGELRRFANVDQRAHRLRVELAERGNPRPGHGLLRGDRRGRLPVIARRKAGSHAPVLARATHGLRSSSAASPHVPGPRKGTRRSNARREIREQPR